MLNMELVLQHEQQRRRVNLKANANVNSYLYLEMEPSQPIVDQLTRKTCIKALVKECCGCRKVVTMLI